MAKADLELVRMVLKRQSRDDLARPDIAEKILKEIQEETKSDDDDEKEPVVKKQSVIIVYDPEGELDGKELTGISVQIPEDESVYTAVEKLHRAGYAFNTTKKGRRMPVKTLGEIVEHVPAKLFKEEKIWVRSGKEPCYVLPTDGLLPTDNSTKKQDKRRVAAGA